MNQEFFGRLLERQAVGRVRRQLGLDLARKVGDGLLEVGVMPGNRQGRAVLYKRLGQRAAAMMRIRKAANGREVFGSAQQNLLELLLRFLEQLQFNEGAAKRDAR